MKKITNSPYLGLAAVIVFAVIMVALVWTNNFLASKKVNVDLPKASAKIATDTGSEESKRINEKIREKGGKWEAGDTSVSGLSMDEKKKRVMQKLDAPAPTQTLESPVTAIPSSLDWRNNNSMNYVTPVKNQLGCGSCWAFASAATAESANLIAQQKSFTEFPIDMSEQVLVSCGNAGSCDGGYPYTASLFIKNTGLPTESCYPYTATNGDCTLACANWQNNVNKVTNVISISGNKDPNILKNALNTYGPVSVTMAVYYDFYYYRTGIYSYATGTLVGYHAIEAVGYDDATQSFIVKNSWGTSWGESGYFRIAYSQMSNAVNFASSIVANQATSTPIVPDTKAPTVSITSPASGATVSGNTNVTAVANDDFGINKIEFYVDGKLGGTSYSSNTGTFIWTTGAVADGSHTLQAKAYDYAGNIGSSSPVTVNVLNTDTFGPAVTMTSPVQGGTYTKTMKVAATAIDNVKVVSMQAMIDQSTVCSSVSGTLSCNVNISKKFSRGAHSVTVKAMDAAGNNGYATVNVTFK